MLHPFGAISKRTGIADEVGHDTRMVRRPRPRQWVMELREHALRALELRELPAKLDAVRCLHAATAIVDSGRTLVPSAPLPGRPERPVLVAPDRLPRRSAHTASGRAALLHAIAHIEFNAVNLALDAIWRFPGLPEAYYLDWLQVAGEEAHHFTLLSEHLATLGHGYGDFDAHDGLWAMCEKTAGDLVARLALVPRTLEARGLDATPALRQRLERAGDRAAAGILDVILRDEIGHVAIGNRWYRWACDQQGLEPVGHHELIARRHGAPRPKPPFNLEARRAAGFDEAELLALQSPGTGAASLPFRETP
jgi:uncharacterized ferritin-like protein (DUF455 family)